MNAHEALATLRRYESELRARGVTHAAVFGSVARGVNREGSDIDIMIDVGSEAALTVFGYVDLKDHIAGLFDGQFVLRLKSTDENATCRRWIALHNGIATT